MTTTASKAGLKAAAAKRTAKHAQRTPLPSVARRAEIREQNVAELLAESPSARYGMMTVVELKAEAKKLGLVTYTLRTKGALMNAILARLQESPKTEALAEAKVDATFSGPQPGDEIEIEQPAPGSVAAQIAERLDGKSGAKAERFAGKALDLGWKATCQSRDPEHAQIVATREGESIVIEWLDGVFDNQTCFHKTPSGRALKLRNASHALKRMSLAPADVAREDARVGVHTKTRTERRSAATGQQAAPHAPFFAEDVSDEEVLASVAGKTITWVNGISGALESDTVAKRSESGEILVKHPASGRAISFLGRAGFRTVRVSAIVNL